MRRLIPKALVAVSIIVLVSCAGGAELLGLTINQSTQDEVSNRLGPPYKTRQLEGGEMEWSYRYRAGDSGPFPQGPLCLEYILRFGADQILREWKEQKCQQ